MILCSRPECQTTAGCVCGKYQSCHVKGVTPTGCICPGDATPFCKNPLCPRKAPPSPFAPVDRPFPPNGYINPSNT